VFFHHSVRFVARYEERFEREYSFFWPIIKDVVERYLDCGNPRCGFSRIRCPRCRAERLLSWRHTGFSVHSRVRAKTKTEAERVGQYMIRPLWPGSR